MCSVKCHIACTPEGGITIEVEDEGAGFDYHHLDATLPIITRNIQKRGYVLIRSICNGISFNESGNHVTVVLNTSQNLLQMQMR